MSGNEPGQKTTDLLRREIDSDTMQRPEDLVNERLLLSGLLHDKMSSTLLCDFDERITRHILYT